MTAIAETTSRVSGPQPFYSRVSALGLLLFVAGGALSIVGSLLSGDVGTPIFIALFLVIGLVVAALTYRFGTWASIVAAVFGGLLLILLAPFAPTALGHPQSFFDFSATLLMVVGLLMALAGAVAAIVQRRAARPRSGANGFDRAMLLAVFGLVGLLLLFSAAMSVAGRTTVAAEAKAGATAVEMRGTQFAPQRLEARPGETLKLVVTNRDAVAHTFTARELGIDATVLPGSERLIELRAPASGSYTYFCVPHEYGMRGTLEIK